MSTHVRSSITFPESEDMPPNPEWKACYLTSEYRRTADYLLC